MRPTLSGLCATSLVLGLAASAAGQELEPRAYAVTPVGVNFVLVKYVLNTGDVSFDPALPAEDATATINTGALSYGRAVDLFGRTANVAVVVPYVTGHLEGLYVGEFTEVDRSGLADPMLRIAVNLYGAPAMNPREFASFRRETTVGFSLRVLAPLGQYDPKKLINLGANRWSFKPEIGVSRALGKWSLELYAGVWLFMENTNFSGGKRRTQDPIGSFQLHAIHTFRRGLWLAVNANFYVGGTTTLDGRENLDLQENSRVGATLSLPIGRRHSLKLSYSRGAYTRIGADFDSFAVGYQYAWGGGL